MTITINNIKLMINMNIKAFKESIQSQSFTGQIKEISQALQTCNDNTYWLYFINKDGPILKMKSRVISLRILQSHTHYTSPTRQHLSSPQMKGTAIQFISADITFTTS